MQKINFFIRLDQEMLAALDDEARKIGETRSTIARMMLRQSLQARGYFADPAPGETRGVLDKRARARAARRAG